MKYFFIFLSILLIFTKDVNAAEEVESFSSEITINQDTSVSISEKIVYQTDEDKHGIYRYVPYKYSINGLNYLIDIDQQKITDEKGEKLEVKTERESGNIVWRIGDSETTFTGQKSYLINYVLSDTVKQYENHDELYLDITGEGWQFQVNQPSVTINSPFAKIGDVVCFAGVVGTSEANCKIEKINDLQVIINSLQPINYGENFTVVLELERPNQLIFPTQSELIIKKIIDNLWLLLVPIPLIFMFVIWYKYGRDLIFISPNIFDMDKKPERLKGIFERQRTPMVYQPLSSLTPGEAGAILDEKVDNRDIVAEIIDLARKKYLSISPISTKKLIFTKRDYTFKKLKDSDDKLPAHQKYLHEQLFLNKSEISMSELKGKFYQTMQKVSEMIYTSTTDKKYFTKNPTTSMMTYGVLAVVVFGIIGFIVISLNSLDPTLPIILVGGQLIFLPFFVLGMVQKSAIGSNFSMQAKGLKSTIQRGSWREKIHEKNLFFDEVLPFAIAFNVVEKLASDMKSLNIKPPQYLATTGWTTSNFVTDLNHFGSTAQKTLAYNPSSSKAGGGSGFSGGSSGGGGGGSW